MIIYIWVLIYITTFTFAKYRMEMGFKFTLLIYSIAKLSSVQFITAQKMQTYDFDFYCHFNPLQKLFSLVLPSWKNPSIYYLVKPICSQKNLIWKDNFLSGGCVLALTYNFLKNFTTILNNLPSEQRLLTSLVIHSSSRS